MEKLVEKLIEKPDQNCCNAIQESIGNYYYEIGQVFDATVLNNLLQIEIPELIDRTQKFEAYLRNVNVIINKAFSDLIACSKCGSNTCCEGTASAISNTGVGFVRLGFQAVASLGNPIISVIGIPNLDEVLAMFIEQLNAALLIILGEGCGNNCDNNCGENFCDVLCRDPCGQNICNNVHNKPYESCCQQKPRKCCQDNRPYECIVPVNCCGDKIRNNICDNKHNEPYLRQGYYEPRQKTYNMPITSERNLQSCRLFDERQKYKSINY